MRASRWTGLLPGPLYRIRYRLLLVNALIVAIPLLGILVARFYEKEMLISLESDMIHQAQLLRQVLLADERGMMLEERGAMLRRAAGDTRTRIRLLDPAGTVLADSHRQGPPEGVEHPPRSLLDLASDTISSSRGYRVESPNRTLAPVTRFALDGAPPRAPQDEVATRPEIRAAMNGRYGAATRIWKNGDLVYLFSALPVVRAGRVEAVVYVTRTTVPVRLAMQRLRVTFVKVLAASLAGTAVLSIFLAGTISRPLGKLTRIAERIAAGDRTRAMSVDRKDEIGQLARAFDAMTRKLDERAIYIAELAANISHEFKSPLTSIRGATELLLEGAADDPAARRRFLENILADAHRLDRLVTRLLELSRFEADAAPDEVVDYEALVRETAGARSTAGMVAIQYAARATQVRGRRAHLASALGNLIDNALQHAAPGTTVTVRISDGAAGRVETRVHNVGSPISEANLPRVWDRFFTTRSAEGGTGLGLPIVATVVAGHGGSIAASSTAEEGTTFRFDLPIF